MYGQLGDGFIEDRWVYQNVVPGKVVAIAAGSRHSMILKQDGTVWATGYNLYGQIGDGSVICKTAFVQVVSGGAVVIAGGQFHSMLLAQDGSLWATGSNHEGRFGDGSTNSKTIFARIKGFGQPFIPSTLPITFQIHRLTSPTTTTTALMPIGRHWQEREFSF